MKAILLLIASTLMALDVSGDSMCRPFGAQPRDSSDVQVLVNRTINAYFEYDKERFEGSTVALFGRICDHKSLEPIANLTVRVVRVAGELPAGKAPSTENLFSAFKEVDSRLISTTDSGWFSVVGLRPGKYVLIPEWSEETTAGIKGILFDLRQSASFALLSQYARPRP